jgi:hypothetical protein
MREYQLQRFVSSKESTGGGLFLLGHYNVYAPPVAVSQDFKCFVVEDQWQRGPKVPGETRIPAGRYELKLRTEGGMHTTYAAKYTWHKGMLWLQGVPGFEWVYIHTGNKESETDGCLLTGDGLVRTTEGEYETTGSVASYTRLYREIVESMEREQVFVTVVDLS